jgi:hypothetical protein
LSGQECAPCAAGLECVDGACLCTPNSCVGDNPCCNADLTVCLHCGPTETCVELQCTAGG